MVTEESIRNSFKNVKQDIAKIHVQLLELSSKQIEILGLLQQLRGKEFELEAKVRKKRLIRKKKK